MRLLAFCALGCTGTIGAAAGAPDGGAAGDDAGERVPAVVDEAAALFDPQARPTFEIDLAQQDWDWLNQNAALEQYRPGTFKYGGLTLDNVGVRFKGSCGSLLSTPAYGKFSWKVSFDQYVPGQRFFGLKHIILNADRVDPTLLKQRFAFHVFRQMGVPASRANNAVLYFNGQFHGVYVNVETVDSVFLDVRFGRHGGALYKQMWPMWPDAVEAYQESTRGEGWDPAMPDMGPQPDVSGMVAFASAVMSTPPDRWVQEVSRFYPPKELVEFEAAERAVSQWDGIWKFYRCTDFAACFTRPACAPEIPWRNHNYFWYQEPHGGRFWLMPWDFDHTFEYSLGADFSDAVLPDGSPGPLFAQAHDAEHEAYLDALEAAVALLDPVAVTGTLESWAAQISDDILMDPEHGGQSRGQWLDSVNALRGQIASQRATLVQYLQANGRSAHP